MQTSPLFIAWGFLLALALAGCSEVEAQPNVRRIVYWEKWTGFEDEAMGRVVDRFNARERARAESEPGYRPIEVTKVTISKIEQKLLVAIAGGNPPDLAGTFSYLIASYADKGALLDLTARLAAAGIHKDRYAARYYELGEYEGGIYGLPTTPSTLALHYNPRLFREAGLDPEKPPRTLEELELFAEKLTRWEVTQSDGSTEVRSGYLPKVPAERKRLIQAGFLPNEPGWWDWSWGYFFGGSLLEGDRITTAAPENIRAFQWVASFSKHLGYDAIQRFRSGFGNFSSPQNPFMSGKVAMMIQGVWMFNFIEKYAPGMQWAASAFPHPADRPDLAGASDIEADMVVIPSGSRHPDEAFEFIRFLSSPEMMELLCLGQKKHSPLAEPSPEFLADHPHPYVQLFQSLAHEKGAFGPPKSGIYNRYLRELGTAFDEVISLRISPEQALLGVQERMQAAYDREQRVLIRRTAAEAKAAP